MCICRCAVLHSLFIFCLLSSCSLPPSPPPPSCQVLVDVTGEEFETFMDLLMQLQYVATAEGVQEVMAAISEQAELTSEFRVREQRVEERGVGRY